MKTCSIAVTVMTALLALSGGAIAASGPAAAGSQDAANQVANPYAPNYDHPYRGGGGVVRGGRKGGKGAYAITSITDYAGRAETFDYSSGPLTKIT